MSTKVYDLRSDTITLPTAAMRKAMADAPVGDDVYGEDPTVNRLEAMAADMLGMEAALYVSSGSMGNLIPLYLNAGRGTEVLTAAQSHIIQHEIGSMASIAGTLPIAITAPRGILTPALLKDAVKPVSYDLARTAMVEIENTIGGYPYQLAQVQDIVAFARAHKLVVHMDGARLFNAVVATGTSARDYTRGIDTVTFCLSKGLGAPVGAMLCGTRDFIASARSVRKLLGGGMRQSGIIAAAGIYALENNIARLADDHAHAQAIAGALQTSGWAQVDMQGVATNIVFFTVPGMTNEDAVAWLAQKGIKVGVDGGLIRLVTNLTISEKDTEGIIQIISTLEPHKEKV